MITQTQYENLLIKHKPFQDKLNEYKDYILTLGLTFQYNYDMLIMEFKTKQFAKLMATDKGLSLEYNTLLKSDAAKAKKINDKIDLNGWDEPVMIKEYLNKLELFNKQFNVSSSHGGNFAEVALKVLINNYKGDISAYLKESILNWEGLENERLLFNTAYLALTELMPLITKVSTIFNPAGITQSLIENASFERDSNGFGIVKIMENEVRLHYFLKRLKK